MANHKESQRIHSPFLNITAQQHVQRQLETTNTATYPSLVASSGAFANVHVCHTKPTNPTLNFVSELKIIACLHI